MKYQRGWKKRYPGRYKKLSARQRNKCAICLQKTILVIDHDHITDEVRGLLCHRCNMSVGMVEGYTDLEFRRLLKYLKNPPFKKMLEKEQDQAMKPIEFG